MANELEILRNLLLVAVGLYSSGYFAAQWWKDGWRPAVEFASLCVLAFVVLLSYALARPAVENAYLKVYGARLEPLAWIAGIFVGIALVSTYNRFSTQARLHRVFATVSIISVLVLCACLVLRSLEVGGATFLLYMWKDFYIVFLIELFWTFANTVFPVHRARWAYGAFCSWGAIGGLVGGLSVAGLVEQYGEQSTLLLMVPLLGGAAAVFVAIARRHAVTIDAKVRASFGEGFRRVGESRALRYILGLVALSQVTITLVDFRWKLTIEAEFPERMTAALGQVYALVSVGELVCQMVAGLLLKFLGVGGVLVAIPALLGTGLATLLIAPSYPVMAGTKWASKTFDYSLFRIAKEMLYIPLSYEEKVQGKAVIDVLAYRAAKGLISLLLLVPLVQDGTVLSIFALVAVVAWIALTRFGARRNRAGD